MKLGDPLLTARPVRACKVCGSPDKGDFNEPDETWKDSGPDRISTRIYLR